MGSQEETTHNFLLYFEEKDQEITMPIQDVTPPPLPPLSPTSQEASSSTRQIEEDERYI